MAALFRARFHSYLQEPKCGARSLLSDKGWTLVRRQDQRNSESMGRNDSLMARHDYSCTHRNLLHHSKAARMVQNKLFGEIASATRVPNARCDMIRWMQTVPDTLLTHPWTRDRLAERSAILRERRKANKLLKERFRKSTDSFYQDTSTASTPYPSPYLQTPLPSQPLAGVLQPRTPEEAKVAPLVARTDLIITRNIEWANVLIGFEQENRYVIMDPRQGLSVVGFIAETSDWFFRQFLRSRRPFRAAIMDAVGSVLFMVRRPIWIINSTIFAEIDGKVVGFVKRRWHLWRRIYDLYIGKKQFAVVVNPGFWNWTFTLKDENGRVLAEIDRHFRGFGYEMLTDAGQYAIRFGDVAPNYQPRPTSDILTAAKASPSQLPGINVNSEAETDVFTVDRPLTLLERAVTLALAVSLDNDYFSRHGGGWFMPFPFMGGGEE